MQRKRLWIVGGIFAAAGGGGWAAFHERPEVVEVQLEQVVRQDLQARVTANGRVQAQKKVDLSATIPGQVTRLAVEEGDRVQKGQFLLQIDSANPRATARSSEHSMQALRRDLDSARANRDQADADLGRARNNHAAGIIPDAEMDRARTALATAEAGVAATQRRVEQAQATLEGARDTLSKTTVRSPMDGIVTAKRIEEGEVAVIGVQNQPGTVLLTISDMSIVEAVLEVDETAIPSVKVGQEALARLDAYPNRTFEALVTEVGSSPIVPANSQNSNEAIKFTVKAQLKHPPEGIKPGLSVQAEILTGFRSQALVVPIQSLIVRDIKLEPGQTRKPGEPREEEGVYVKTGQEARFQRLQTGLLGELHVEVTEGLAGAETVITGPFRALRELKDGDLIKQREEQDGDGRS